MYEFWAIGDLCPKLCFDKHWLRWCFCFSVCLLLLIFCRQVLNNCWLQLVKRLLQCSSTNLVSSSPIDTEFQNVMCAPGEPWCETYSSDASDTNEPAGAPFTSEHSSTHMVENLEFVVCHSYASPPYCKFLKKAWNILAAGKSMWNWKTLIIDLWTHRNGHGLDNMAMD